ncbi:hypothetical protein FJV83_05150 [Mesorhizobium sp. WSM4307]|uniref:hypothetical protein n=1 Tax=unclassified Mesorhizobium TaxID=325217 RepID=UPI00115CD56A|nr:MULTISPECIES: hypothetical protein [unclassified Mesorhizobium]TRC81115.1 hypothetical protein FJV81_05035 [Mesorhizobium sp. WSM4315]TRC87297.1 hypothetical protein FJV83_05150 [Mesorhizobium sp. WSM4307]
MSSPRDEIQSLIHGRWDAKRFKEILSRTLAIGSRKDIVKNYIETDLRQTEPSKYLEMVISNPRVGQIIPARQLFDVDVINENAADEVISCIFGHPKLTRLVSVAFFIKENKLVQISVRNKGETL